MKQDQLIETPRKNKYTRKEKQQFGFEPQNVTASKLQSYIGHNQLTPEIKLTRETRLPVVNKDTIDN